jgi:hypothetical protein
MSRDSSGLAVDSGMIAAFAAVSGSFVGSLGSVVGGWANQSRQGHRAQRSKEIAAREAVNSDSSARLLLDAFKPNVTDPQRLIPLDALPRRIRLRSSSRVLEKAEAVATEHFSDVWRPNLTTERDAVFRRKE